MYKFDEGASIIEVFSPDSDGDVLVTMSDAYDNIDIFLDKHEVEKLIQHLEICKENT